MFPLHPRHGNTLTSSTALAILCTLFSKHALKGQQDVLSEIVCWVIVPVLYARTRTEDSGLNLTKATLHSQKDTAKATPIKTLWIIALCLAAGAWYSAEYGVVVLYPFVLAMMHMIEGLNCARGRTSITSEGGYKESAATSLGVAGLIGLCQSLVLADWNVSLRIALAPSVLAVAFVYASFQFANTSTRQTFPSLDFEKHSLVLSLRVLGLLVGIAASQTLFKHYPFNIGVYTLSTGVLKALSWYYASRVALETSWQIAPTIATFSILSNHSLLTEPLYLVHILKVAASCVALAQIVLLLPVQTKQKSILWCFVAMSVLYSWRDLHVLHTAQSVIATKYSTQSRKHPIEDLVSTAQTKFSVKLEHQSQTYDAARAEYTKRYGIEPPRGFKHWFQYAVDNKSPIIDDYDMIFRTVAPFLRVSGKDVNEIVGIARNTPGVELWTCAFTSAEGTINCTHPTRINDRHISRSLNELLSPLQGILPDIRFLVNHLDEPRVSIPLEQKSSNSFTMTDLAEKSTWGALARRCHQYLRTEGATRLVDEPHPRFVTNVSEVMDICHHLEYKDMHGMIKSPTSFKLIEELVPILSTGALSTMGDLLFPSPAYTETPFQYRERDDMPWEQKENSLYWTGANTGGYTNDNTDWTSFHRQRFITLTQGYKDSKLLHSHQDNFFQRLLTSSLNKNLFSTSFTKISQCSNEACSAQRSFFNLAPPAPSSEIYSSRLAFDLDGNGISGRFYKLLASHSLPLKQTLLHEWHSERLMPWVHYIPISMGMEELQDVVWYLTLDEKGKTIAKEIAEEGRKWFNRAMGIEDRSVYVYRLMLELGRVMDVEREALL